MSVCPAVMCHSVTQVECKKLPILLNAFDADGNGKMILRRDRQDVLNGKMRCHDDEGDDAYENEYVNVNADDVDGQHPGDYWTR